MLTEVDLEYKYNMPLVFDNITVDGITLTDELPTLRGLLSPTGQAAYDAASVGDFFYVSSTDYANVASGLLSTSKYVMNDSQLAVTGAGWTSTNGGFAHATSVSTVPSGTYIIGFVYATRTTAGTTATPLISTAFPPTATYNAISNTVTGVTLNSLNYYIRKTAPSATSSISYLGLGNDGTVNANNEIAGQKYYSISGPPYTSWTVWNNISPIYQVLTTTLAQW